MKPANFPGRKEARRIAAKHRSNPELSGVTAREVHESPNLAEAERINHERSIHTKKDRGGMTPYRRIA